LNAFLIPPEYVSQFWPHVKNLIYSAFQRGGLGSFSAVEGDTLAGRALLWLAWDGKLHGVAITQIQQTEFEKSCVILACGGTGISEWLPLLETLERYAKSEGCKVIRLFGRKGWMKKLPMYKQKHIVLERQL